MLGSRTRPDRPSAFRCRCERPVYFYNSICLGCQAPLGYEPELLEVRALRPGPEKNTWLVDGNLAEPAKVWKRCENFNTPAGCNWLT